MERAETEQGPNLYQIVKNNPPNFVDADGRGWWPPGGGDKDEDDGDKSRDAIKSLPKKLRQAWKRFNSGKPGTDPCLCLDSVTAYFCRCIRDNITDIDEMARCLCATIPDEDCEYRMKKAFRDVMPKLGPGDREN